MCSLINQCILECYDWYWKRGGCQRQEGIAWSIITGKRDPRRIKGHWYPGVLEINFGQIKFKLIVYWKVGNGKIGVKENWW